MSDMQEPPEWVTAPDDPGTENATVIAIDWRSELACNTKGVPLNNLDNAIRIIQKHPDLCESIWYDEFLDSIVTTWQGPERKWRDIDDILLQLFMQRYMGLISISVNAAHDAVLAAAFHNVKNECKAYLTDQTWDETPRLAHVMHEAFGAEDSPYSAAVGRCWWTSMVARVMRPGCKVDTVPVLEGPQGAGKSTALGIIGGKWFVECHESVTTKDFFGVLDGHMLVEVSEMHAFSRSDIERIKGLISCPVDRYRKAYGRTTEDHPRQSVLACTTNRNDWQKDDTGARRFWPILCGAIDLDYLRNNRDQLFAEAVTLFKADMPWWDVPEADQQAQTEARRDADSWEAEIATWVIGRDSVTTTEILRGKFDIPIAEHDRALQRRVGSVMRVLGWQSKTIRDGKEVSRAWIRAGM